MSIIKAGFLETKKNSGKVVSWQSRYFVIQVRTARALRVCVRVFACMRVRVCMCGGGIFRQRPRVQDHELKHWVDRDACVVRKEEPLATIFLTPDLSVEICQEKPSKFKLKKRKGETQYITYD